MKYRFLLLLALVASSCTTNENAFSSIEFMKYDWSRYNDTTKLVVPFFLKCRMYVNIDSSGNGKMYIYKSYPIPESDYYSFTPDRNIIDNILLNSESTDSLRNKIDKNIPFHYDGPALKLRITSSQKESKLFSFIDVLYAYENQDFIKFYHYLDSIPIKNKITHLTDSDEFEKSRLDFIRFIRNYDSINFPQPILEYDSLDNKFVPRVIYKK